MSLKVMSSVFELQIPSAAKFVLLALADRADGQGYCFPGQKELSLKTSLSIRAVQRNLIWLEENGYLKRNHRRRKDGYRSTDEYQIISGGTESGDLKSGDKLSRDNDDDSQAAQSQGNIITNVIIEQSLEPSINARARNEVSELKFPKKKSGYTEEFETFWKTYPPNGASKYSSHQSYQKALKETDHATIIRGAAGYANDCKRTGRAIEHIAHATTWLNQQRWDVDYSVSIAAAPGAAYGKPGAVDPILMGTTLARHRALQAQNPFGQDTVHTR